jgi:hypothetical protein
MYLQALFRRLFGKPETERPSKQEINMDEADKAEIASFEIPVGLHFNP